MKLDEKGIGEGHMSKGWENDCLLAIKGWGEILQHDHHPLGGCFLQRYYELLSQRENIREIGRQSYEKQLIRTTVAITEFSDIVSQVLDLAHEPFADKRMGIFELQRKVSALIKVLGPIKRQSMRERKGK